MLEVASMQSFPGIELIKDKDDRELRLIEAKHAVARLREMTETYASDVSAQERIAAEQEVNRAQAEAQRRFGDEIHKLRERFLGLQNSTDQRARGIDFETLLSDLFRLFDMEPRLSYELEREQIDGSLSFDTDDYVVEARWRNSPTDRAAADVFAAKVRRKGKNALGLFVSISGFTQDAIAQYNESTPFLAVDGSDIYLVLDYRIRLDDMLKQKKRHANETGRCFLASADIISG